MVLLPHSAWLAVPIAWLVFFAVARVTKAALHGLPEGPRWRSPAVVVKIALLAVSLAAMALSGFSLYDVGFRAPARSIWGASIGLGLMLGAVGTLVVLVSGLQGLRKAMKGQSFASIVVWVWIVSSVVEEVYCRGWFQTSTMPEVAQASFVALLPSAVLFGSMHLLLLSAGVDRASVAFVVASTTVLGLLCAWARVASDSLYPAIAAHVAFNVGGALGGIVYAIAYRGVTGKMPFQEPTPAASEARASRVR
jgi:membrane protease YdiL (CAAX protease family)